MRVLRFLSLLRIARAFSAAATLVQETILRHNLEGVASEGLKNVQAVLNGAGVLELCLQTLAMEEASPALFAAAAQVGVRMVAVPTALSTALLAALVLTALLCRWPSGWWSSRTATRSTPC